MIVITLKVYDRVQNNDKHMHAFPSCNRHRGTIIEIHSNGSCEVRLDKEDGVSEGYVWKLHEHWLDKIDDNMSNHAEYNFAGNIKVTIDENRGVWKLNFDPGNVDFKAWRTPRDYGDSTRTETYLGIPIINFDGDSGWWINLSDLDGEHNINKGELKQFPLYTTKEYCDKFIKAVEVIVDKFIEVGYIKQEKEIKTMETYIPMNYKFGDIIIKFNNTQGPDIVTLTVNGMKSIKDLPEEYLNGYPNCYKDGTAFVLTNSNEQYVMNDGACRDSIYYLFTTESDYAHKFNIDVAQTIVKEIEKCVERLREINHKNKGEENMFNGLEANVESIVYDFSGCTVKISKTDDEDRFVINIDPGNWKFNVGDKRGKYAFEISGLYDHDWWINENRMGSKFNNSNNHFKNGDRFTIEDINKILLNVKGGVESRSIKTDVCKVKLMTREEMLELLDKSELLPSEICKKKYEMFKEYCVVNNVCSVDEEEITDEDAIGSSTCALCEVYHNRDGCNNCPLEMVDHYCGMDESSYRKLCDYDDDDHDEFIECIDNMIETLDKAIEYEKKITHIFTESEMKALCAEGKMTAAEISLEIWRQKEAYVKTHKNCVSHYILLKLNDDIAGNCALCHVQESCFACPLTMIGAKCRGRSSYDNVLCYTGGNHEEFLDLVHKMVLTLEKAVEYEKKEKCKNKDLVEIPERLCSFNCSGVNIITRPIDNGLFKVSIDSNGYDLTLLQSESVEFVNDHEFVYFWKSLNGEYDWFLISDIIDAMLNEKDKSKFNNAHFNNGINLSKEGTQILVSILKKYFEAAAKNGNLKRK